MGEARVMRADRSQLRWDMVDLEALLAGGHRARAVRDFVEGPDFGQLCAAVKSRAGGAPGRMSRRRASRSRTPRTRRVRKKAEGVIVPVKMTDRRNDAGLAGPMAGDLARRYGRTPARLPADTG